MRGQVALGQPRGVGRAVWNFSMIVALAIMGTAAVYVAWNKKWGDVAFGKYALIIFGILLVCGHYQRQITRLTKHVTVMDNQVRQERGGRRRGGKNKGQGGKPRRRQGQSGGTGSQSQEGKGNPPQDAGEPPSV